MKLLGPVHSWEARRALRAARRAADDELLETSLAPPRLAWRVEELTDDQHRLELGRAVTHVVHAADERLLPTASPIDRPAIRVCRAELLELASRLCDLGRPVAARGVVRVDRLLTSDRSPLFGRCNTGRLRAAVAACLEDLHDH